MNVKYGFFKKTAVAHDSAYSCRSDSRRECVCRALSGIFQSSCSQIYSRFATWCVFRCRCHSLHATGGKGRRGGSCGGDDRRNDGRQCDRRSGGYVCKQSAGMEISVCNSGSFRFACVCCECLPVWSRRSSTISDSRFFKRGEMLGAAGIQIAFNVSNATSAAIGGLVINRGYGVESTALTGIPFALTGMVCFLLLYRKFRTQGA